MKVLVAVKHVVDHNVRIRVRPDGSGVETHNVRHSINPFCRHAVEAAVTLREHGQASEVVAVTIGPARADDALLTALAMGADRAIHLLHEARIEPLAVAGLLRAIALEQGPDLILLGKQSVDDDACQTGQMLAGLLGWPQATFASTLAVDRDGLKVTREMDYGRATYALPLPAIVTADLGLGVPRNVALPMVMKARKMPRETRPADSFGIDLTPRLIVEGIAPPPHRAQGRTISSVEELLPLIAAEISSREAS